MNPRRRCPRSSHPMDHPDGFKALLGQGQIGNVGELREKCVGFVERTMSYEIPDQETTFGYLSALEFPGTGFLGGYLLISPLGRPLEFHCSAPLQPSPAQQILFGPCLRNYVVGEQIGGALLAAAQTTPHILLVDQVASFFLRSQMTVPVACWQSSLHRVESTEADRCASGDVLSVAGHHWSLAPGYESDRDRVVACLTQLSTHVDLPEPFTRIQRAIREAQRIDEQGPTIADRAA